MGTPKKIKKKPRRVPVSTKGVQDNPYLVQEIEHAVVALLNEARETSDATVRRQIHEAIEAVEKTGDIEVLFSLARYRRTPVDLEEFLYGNLYLGLHPSEIFPGVLEDLTAFETGKYVEAVLKGSIGGGKTTAANLGILRQLYSVSCLRSPQQTFGVQRNSSIVFTIQSVRLSTAKKAVFQEMGQYIQNSPYFTEVYPYDTRITSEMIFREQHITILPVSSSDTGAISMNVIGGLLDEANFMEKIMKSKKDGADVQGEYDQAKNLYNTLSKRRRSRFMARGKLPGLLFLVSSSRYPDDFTELKALESSMLGGHDDTIYVSSRSLWEAKGRERYMPENFYVVPGDELRPSKMYDTREDVPAHITEKDVVAVPEDFRSEFNKDLDGSIRDLAGRTTLATHPFIQKRETIYSCMSAAERFGYGNLFAVEQCDLSIGFPPIIEERIRLDVKQMRVVHVDLSVSRDSAGLAIGHIAGTRTISRHDVITNTYTTEVLPVVAIDGALRINPPPGKEIDFSLIRQLIILLRDTYHLPIKVLTSDGFQSVDFRQIMAKKKFVTEYVSMDKTTEPYKSARTSLYDERLLLPRHHILNEELAKLEFTRAGSKEKIDHPPRGSKDVADAVTGVNTFLLTRRGAWSAQPPFLGEGGYAMYGNRTAVPGLLLQKKPVAAADRKQTKRPTTNRSKVGARKPADRTT